MDKQRLRFSVSDDITLLKEVLCENPFENIEKWKCIQEKVNVGTNKTFSVRCLREHLQHLMSSFLKEDNINRKKSGTEEELTELKVILQNVIDLSNEFRPKQHCLKKSTNSCKKANPGVLSRNESVVFSQLNLNNELPKEAIDIENCFIEIELPHSQQMEHSTNLQTTEAETPVVENQGPAVAQRSAPFLPNSTRKRNPMLEYLREKQQMEQSMKKEELEIQSKRLRLEEITLQLEKDKLQLEKEKLDFEKMKFNVETKEREERLKLEMEERRERLQGEREQRQMLLEIFKSAIIKK